MTPSQKVPLLADYFAFDRILTHPGHQRLLLDQRVVFALMLLTRRPPIGLPVLCWKSGAGGRPRPPALMRRGKVSPHGDIA